MWQKDGQNSRGQPISQTGRGGIGLKWEYKTFIFRTKGIFGGKVDPTEFDALLNELGREGWELTAAVSTIEVGQSRDVVAIFKRQAGD